MEAFERYLVLGDEILFIRHTEILRERPTLLFLHGLGESGLCFMEAFSCALLSGYNLIAPDHIGYGRSSKAARGDYSFLRMIGRLEDMAAILGIQEFALIGHSMGGILGTLWCMQDKARRIRRMVNVEGNVTSADALFSGKAVAAFEKHRDFDKWHSWFLSEFAYIFSLDARPSMRRYFASLLFARPRAFLENSTEIVARGRSDRQDQVNEFGETYRSLGIPRMYFWGRESLSKQAREFLEREALLNRGFSDAGHWPMIDSTEFYPALSDFLETS